MRASSLTSRITITGPTTTEDALGQPSTTWDTVMTVWGDARFKTGLQGVNAERIDSGQDNFLFERLSEHLDFLLAEQRAMVSSWRNLPGQGADHGAP